MTTRFLTVESWIYISEQIPDEDTIHRILKARRVRDMDLLETPGAPDADCLRARRDPTLERKPPPCSPRWRAITRSGRQQARSAVAANLMPGVNGRCVAWDQERRCSTSLDLQKGHG